MVSPYRAPTSIDPDTTGEARARTLDRWIRAISGAAVIFLLTTTAMMLSLMRDMVQLREFHGDPAPSHPAKFASHQGASKATPPLSQAPPPPVCAAPPFRDAAPPRAFLAPLGLASLGAATHDPTVLLARAMRLRADGADLTITRSLLPMPVERALGEAFTPHARIAAGIATGGVEIQSLPADSPALLAGLQKGDVVTAVNGHALTRPDSALDAYSSVLAAGVAVLEVIRGERRIVLEARFRPAAITR